MPDQSQQPKSVKKLYQPPKEIMAEHQEFINRIGDKLKQIREREEMSASRLAKDSKLSRNLYHQMEHGRVYFTISSLLRVLDALEISASEFFKDL
jgi:ribosome-binding protein aMBF1 (putative translation factor)